MSQPDAKQILVSRLAAGKITEEEYDRILSRLDAGEPVHSNAQPGQPSPRPNNSARVEPTPSARLESSALKSNPTPTEPSAEASPKRAFYLVRLWRGEISLPVTYWIWGAVIGSIVGLVFGALMGASTTKGEAIIFALILSAWAVFMACSIFRSGRSYTRKYPKKWWGRLAQGVACLGLLASLGNIVHAFPGNEDDVDLDQAVDEANRAGPHMVGDKVRFDNLAARAKYLFTASQ